MKPNLITLRVWGDFACFTRPEMKVERVSYPADIARIRHDDTAQARAIQKASGEKLRRAFDGGLAATGFERGETEGTYLLEPWP